ncbi:MAG TPA: T9SS type A sorting domain-containing protein, partial [Flavisolibacter sp.]|nr:T9SS type A sorting domain-containing protein [Flavisolibacter sp.]
GSISQTFNVFVNDKNTRSIYVNIGTDMGVPADKPWNNLMTYPFPNLVLSNLKDESDVASGYNFIVVDQFAGRFTGGMLTGNNTGVYPDIVAASAFYENTNNTRTFKFSGLNANKIYNVSILSSINTGVSAKSTFSSGGKSITVDARYNSNQTAQLNGLKADVNGEIVITMLKDTAAPWGLLNALVLEEYDSSLPIVNPINLSVTPDSTTRAKLIWSDRSSNETGFEIWRASGTSGAFNLVATVGTNVTTYMDVNLSPSTKYYYEIRAKNGSTFSDYSNIASVIMSKKIVYLNFNLGESPAPSPWNNGGQQLAEGTVVANLKDNTGNNTGFSLNMITHFNDEHDAGNITGNNSGVYPDNVIISTFWMDKNQVSSYKIVGLDQSKAYRLWFFGSFTWGYIADFTTTYTINGRTVYLNCYNANSKAVYIDNVIPNQNGEIYVDVSAPSTSVYGFESSLVIEYYDPSLINQTNSNVSGLTVIKPASTPFVNAVATITPKNVSENGLRQVMVYPNPFRDAVTINYANSERSRVYIEVYDITGKIIVRKDLGIISEGSHTEILDLGSPMINRGTYILNIVRNNKVEKTFKIIKH